MTSSATAVTYAADRTPQLVGASLAVQDGQLVVGDGGVIAQLLPLGNYGGATQAHALGSVPETLGGSCCGWRVTN